MLSRWPSRRFVLTMMTYLMVLMIPVMLGGVAYVRVKEIMLADAKHQSRVLLDQLVRETDAEFKAVSEYATHLSLNPKMQTYAVSTDPESPHSRYLAVELVSASVYQRPKLSLISDMFVYVVGNDAVFTSVAKINSHLHYQFYYAAPGMNEAQYRADVLSPLYPRQQKTADHIDRSSNGEFFTIASTLPIANPHGRHVNLFALIPRERMNTALAAMAAADSGGMYILSADGAEVYASVGDPVPLSVGEHLAVLDSAGIYENDNGLVFIQQRSSINGWRFIATIPREVIDRKVAGVDGLIRAILYAVLIIGIVTAFLLSLYNYNPLKRIYEMVSSAAPIGEPDVARGAQRAVESIITKEAQARIQLNTQVPFIRSEFVRMLLTGQITAETPPNQWPVPLAPGYYHVALVMVKEISRRKSGPSAQRSLLRLAARGVVQEFTADLGNIHMVDLADDQLALLVHGPNLNGKQLKRVYGEMRESVSGRTQSMVTVAVSNVFFDPLDAPDGLRQAEATLDGRIVSGSGTVLFASDILPSEGCALFRYTIEQEISLLGHLRSGNDSAAISLLDAIIEENTSTGALGFPMLKQLMMCLSGTALRAIDETAQDKNGNRQTYAPLLLEKETLPEMRETLTALFTVVCASVRERRRSRNQRILLEARAYVAENLSDPGLSVLSIATALNITPAYLSSYIREQTGQSLLDYIHLQRIERAKVLILLGKPLSWVAEQAGLGSDVALNRAFKRYLGMTPGAYRASVAAETKKP